MRTIIDPRHLLQAHDAARFTRNDDLAEIFRAFHATLHLHHAVLLDGAHRAHRQVLVFIRHRTHHLVGADAQRLHGLRVQINIEFAFGAAHHHHRADTAHVFQAFFQHLVGPVGHLDMAGGFDALGQVFRVGHHGHIPNRAAGRVKAQNARLFHFGAQKRMHVRDFFTHIVSRFAAIHAELKLDDDHRHALVAA